MPHELPPDATPRTRWQRARPWLAFAAAVAVFLLGLRNWMDIGGDPGLVGDPGGVIQLEPGSDGQTPRGDVRSPDDVDPGMVVTPTPDALTEMYEDLGLGVPTAALAKDARPGCPAPPPDPPTTGGPAGPPPWKPAVTVAEDDLPEPKALTPWTSDAGPAEGKGMWIWKYAQTEDEDFAAIVARAVAADLDHLWIRVGDSRDGFYAAERMATLVPLAHEAGLDVIGWGFPFLHDPLSDAAWSAEAMAWRGSDGRGLDGFSPDIERETENVVLTARRVEVYLAAVRADAGDLPVLATVYPPEDWVLDADYPFATMAPYVDAFVPMGYWGCGDAGLMAQNSVQRLAQFGRPVHVIGQAYGNSGSGRRVAPNRAETLRFLDVAAREGAIGASFWVWQSMDQSQWDALTDFPWHAAITKR